MTTVEQDVVTTTPQHYTWFFPGSPLKIYFDLETVRRMQEYLRSGTHGNLREGLLLGKVQAGRTEILDFVPVVRADFPKRIPELGKRRQDLSIVGYYRSHSGESLHLNEDDLSLAKSFFGKPHQVFLLLQEASAGPPNACFFLHEGDRGITNFPFLEFPFDAETLANQERNRVYPSRRSDAVESDAAPLPPAKRRRRRVVVWMLLAGISIGCPLGFTFMYYRDHGMLRWPLFPPPAPASAPIRQETPIPGAASTRLELAVARQNNDLKLTWNGQSPSIAKARSGTLSITDGSLREISLSPAQLRDGNILYAPSASQIQLQLTVNGPEETLSESVLVILPTATQPEPKIVERRVEPPVSQGSSPPLKPFHLPVLPRRADRPDLTLEIPPVPAGAGNPSPQLPSMLATAMPTAPTAAAAASSRPLADADPGRTSTSPTPTPFFPPSILSSAVAIYPTTLKNMSLQPKTVAIKVSIDQNGRAVKSEYLASKEWVPGAMVQSALTATHFFKFKAAQLGDRAIPGDLILRFTFRQN